MAPHFGIRYDYLECWLLDNRRMPMLDTFSDALYATMRLIRSVVAAFFRDRLDDLRLFDLFATPNNRR